jgi:hypothetical protein
MSERDENAARLDRMQRLIADLDSECERSADLRERFSELQRQTSACAKPTGCPTINTAASEDGVAPSRRPPAADLPPEK